MKISLDWLKDFVDVDTDVDTLCAKLVSAGFEVEEIIDLSANMQNVVVGQIEKLEKHPDADKLQICQINVGSEVVQIVTGANNISVGDKVPVAKDNSLLPCGMKIKKGKLRGVDSFGMLCSGEELCLKEADYEGAEVNGIMILKKEYKNGTEMNKILGLDDIVLDVSVTANRPDCNSVLGIAREVATVLKKPLKMPKMDFKVINIKIESCLSVDVEAKDLCPRYMASYVKNIKIKKSPDYIAKRLRAVGLRPINNLVDITNYVLIEIGQPLHAFDYNLLNEGKIVVKKVDKIQKFTTLDNKVRDLDETMLTICDSEKPVAIAGVMGGLGSAINNETPAVVFESAKFMRDNIRRTSRKLNLRTDASTRYERGIDFASQELGLKRALALVDELECGEIVSGIIDIVNGSLNEKVVATTSNRINEILGVEIPTETMSEILNNLQIKTKQNGNVLVSRIPLYREDIENSNDLAEEIIRNYGYDNILARPIDVGARTLGGKNYRQNQVSAIKDVFIANGMYETLTYSFTSPKVFDILNISSDDNLRNTVNLLNPLGEDFSVMRTTLAYSMINTLASNILKSNKNGRFFEFASVYLPKQMPLSEQPNEKERFVFGAFGKDEDFYSVKGIVENLVDKYSLNVEYLPCDFSYMHPGRSAKIMSKDTAIGYFGEVLPDVSGKFDINERIYIGEIYFDELLENASINFSFEEITKYPPMQRDIAILLDEKILAKDVIDCIKKSGGALLRDVHIFDIYRGGQVPKGKKSVAINMMFRNNERTLTDDEVNAKINKILKNLQLTLDAQLR